MTPADVRGLLALLLSSGNLVAYRMPTGGHIQVTMTGGAGDSAYLEEKVAEFKSYFSTKALVVPYRALPSESGNRTLVLRFRCSSDRLRPIYNLLYPRGKRRITSEVLELCGGRAAAWLWAERARRLPEGVRLARVAKTVEEGLLIAQWLKTLLSVDCRLETDRGLPSILLPKAQVRQAVEQLLPFAPLTRKHVFLLCLNDVDPVCNESDLLLLRTRGNGSQGLEVPAGADDLQAGERADLSGSPDPHAAATASGSDGHPLGPEPE